MGTDPIREVLGRPLPELPLDADGLPVSANDVAVWCEAAVELINDLRETMVELVDHNGSGVKTFNRMVQLGNQAAAAIVVDAQEEANRILSSARSDAGAGHSAPTATSETTDAADASFREEWERDASIDERVADRAFFSEGPEEPSRTWILADSA